MYGYGFLSHGFTDRREILHGGLVTSRKVFSHFGGIVPGMAEPLASTGGAEWRDMLLAEALISVCDKMSLFKRSAPYWSNSPFVILTFGHSGAQG